jgi:hypothetical protein
VLTDAYFSSTFIPQPDPCSRDYLAAFTLTVTAFATSFPSASVKETIAESPGVLLETGGGGRGGRQRGREGSCEQYRSNLPH